MSEWIRRVVADAMHLLMERHDSVEVIPTSPTVVRPAAPVVVIREPSVPIQPMPRAAWDAKGWVRVVAGGRASYEGYYEITLTRTGARRRFRGRVVEAGGSVVAYIADPPAEIRRHPKGPCFALVEPPWFRVHWQRKPQNVDDAVLYVESVLDEALNGR